MAFLTCPDLLQADIVSCGGRTISLGDYTEEWKAHRRLVQGALQRCCKQSLHDVIERQALQLRKVTHQERPNRVIASEKRLNATAFRC